MSHTKKAVLQDKRRRRGLTLLELVVVMTILVALGGIVVALLPNMLNYAHTSTGATNMPELNKMFEMHHMTNRGFPNGLDNLVEGDAGGADLYDKLPGTAYLTTLMLTAEMAEALNNAGITKVFNMTDGVTDATFGCYGELADGFPDIPADLEDTRALDVTAGLTVARLTGAEAEVKLKGDPNSVYVVLGVGQATPLVGQGGMMQDAPVHFGDEAGTKPNEAYSRFCAVFKIGEDTGGTLEADQEAQFIGCVALHKGGIAVPWMPIKEFNAAGGH